MARPHAALALVAAALVLVCDARPGIFIPMHSPGDKRGGIFIPMHSVGDKRGGIFIPTHSSGDKRATAADDVWSEQCDSIINGRLRQLRQDMDDAGPEQQAKLIGGFLHGARYDSALANCLRHGSTLWVVTD